MTKKRFDRTSPMSCFTRECIRNVTAGMTDPADMQKYFDSLYENLIINYTEYTALTNAEHSSFGSCNAEDRSTAPVMQPGGRFQALTD